MPTADKIIDYYFSVLSPWTYLGDARMRAIAAKHGYTVRHHPLLSPVLFPATGGVAFKDRAKPRLDYRMQELTRWRAHLGIPINLQPKFFPVAEAPATKLILAALDAGHAVDELTHAILRAVWEEDRDIADPAVLQDIATAQDMDGEALVRTSQEPAYDEKAEAESQAAIARGIFGYPTYTVGDELFWGQDRLDFVERALGGS